MSRIGQLLELKALRADVDALKKDIKAQSSLGVYLQGLEDALKRIESLEAKRGPGRPKNDDRIAAGGN